MCFLKLLFEGSLEEEKKDESSSEFCFRAIWRLGAPIFRKTNKIKEICSIYKILKL